MIEWVCRGRGEEIRRRRNRRKRRCSCRLQVELVEESATIAEELPSVWIGCTPLELLAKPVEIYDRGEHSESVGGGGGLARRFIGVGL